jgi:hypothetical protein
MPSPKQKKTSTPSSPKAPSKQSTKSRKPKKTTKPKISKATPKLDKPKKPTEDTDSVQRILSEQLNNLLPSDDLACVTMKVPALLEEKFCAPLPPYRVLLGYSNLEETPEHCRWAALCLYPGITERRAIKAVKLLVKKLPKSAKPKGGRTAYSPDLWMHEAFERCTNGGGEHGPGDQWITHYLKHAYFRNLSEWQRSPQAQETKPLVSCPELEVLKPGTTQKGAIICRAVAGAFTAQLTFVKEQYRSWLETHQGRKPKRYTTKKLDTRD